MRKLLLAMLAVAGLTCGAFAATPIQLSLWNKVAVPPSDAVYGLEVGIGNNLSEVKGVQWNLVWSQTDSGLGVQAGLLTKITGEFTGLQAGCVSLNEGNLKGLGYGFINYGNTVTGATLGFINYTENLTGLQFGLANYAANAETFGLQIGLINYLGNSSMFKVLPFINAKF